MVMLLLGCSGQGSAPSLQTTIEPPQRTIRICADPDNLPFTNEKHEGFENKIAQLIADDLHANVQYLWQMQRSGFFRGPLTENQYDLVLSAPPQPGRTTDAYYRSCYVFVTRKDSRLNIQSFDDPRLRDLKIGVQMVGDDYADTPPVHALARRGITGNVVRIMQRDTSPPGSALRIIEAVAAREVDVAIVWGPPAGYYATRSAVPLEVHQPMEQIDASGIPLAFDIAMGVSKNNPELRDEITQILKRRQTDIARILDSYGVPRVKATAHPQAVSAR
jgi:mxaJ protein